MTSMFFAGIPIEGSGTRPLEADLYGPDAQNGIHENISATGNLNVGVVIEYDEHADRHMNGGILNEDSNQGPAAPVHESFAGLSPLGPEARNIAYSDNSSTLQNIALPNPVVSATPISAVNNAEAATSAIPPGSVATAQSSTAQSNATESSAHSFSHSNDGSTYIFNTYNDNNTVINNNDTTYNGGTGGSDSHTIDINIGGITIGGGDHHGGGLLNIINSVTTGGIDIIENVVHTAGGLLINLVNTVDNTLTSLTGSVTNGSLLGSVTSTVDNTLNHLGGAGDILGGVVTTVDNTLSHPGGGGDLLGGVVGTVDNTLGHITGGLNLPTLLDANVSALTSSVPAVGGNALINLGASLASDITSSPHAGSSGLINLDTSLLSTSSGPGVSDGLSLNINADAVTHGSLPISVPEINIPLPTLAQAVPVVQPILADATSTVTNLPHDTGVTNLLDPGITLDALNQTAHTVAAVDTGVLFTGTNSNVGGVSHAPAPAPDLHIGNLLHLALGHH